MSMDQLKAFTDIGANVSTILIAAAAAYWFLFTRSFRRRVEFDCDLRIFDVGEQRPYLAELILIVHNKGQREHRLYNLWCEVREANYLSGAAGPHYRYLPTKNLVSEGQYIFVPAGVRQIISTTFAIRRGARIARVEAAFVHQPGYVPLNDEVIWVKTLACLGYTAQSVKRLFVVAPTTHGPIATSS